MCALVTGVQTCALPISAQDRLEVWLGGIAPSELRRCGRLGDGWLPSFCTPDDVRQGIAALERHASEADRKIDPRSDERRVGKAGVRTGRSRGAPCHEKKKNLTLSSHT